MVVFEPPQDRPLDGEDFSEALRGDRFERDRPLYWEFDDIAGFHYALRDGDWKLLASEDLSLARLFNLAEDRHEVLDRAAQQPEVLAEMLAELETIAESVRRDPLRPAWLQTNREGN